MTNPWLLTSPTNARARDALLIEDYGSKSRIPIYKNHIASVSGELEMMNK